MILRQFTRDGVKRFEQYLVALKEDPSLELPTVLLEDDTVSRPIKPETIIEQRVFSNRLELGLYLNKVLSACDHHSLMHNNGLWSWLSLFYFDQVCPADQSGRRKRGQMERYVMHSENFRTRYRHLLATSYNVVHIHRDSPERAAVLLCGSVNEDSEITREFAGDMRLITVPSAVEAATLLYYDPETERPKKKASGKGRGAARRLTTVLAQFDLTWDLHELSAANLIAMLPAEFNRFRPVNPG